MVQTVEELKSIHTLPSLLLYENGVLVHIVEGTSSIGIMSGSVTLICQDIVYAVVAVAGLPQKRPGRKLAAAIRQYLLHECGMCHLQNQAYLAVVCMRFGSLLYLTI